MTKLRGSRLSSRPFYTSVLILSLLTSYSFLAHTGHHIPQKDIDVLLARRSLSLETPECRDVHLAKDKCAFVTEYCADDDAGLIPYLSLYYCAFAKVQPIAFTILVLWLGLLFTTIGIAASDFFSINLSTIATILGLSESLAGVTFLAFGNGSPDVFSTFAAFNSNSASMAVGELIGAASFITGVVAGSMALVREFRVDRKTYTRDICFFIVAVAFTMVFLADGHLHFWECWLMIGYYVVYVITVVCWHWYSTKRKQRLRREGEARSHVYGPLGHSVDELAGEPYRDDPDDVDQGMSTGQTTPLDISVLELGPRIEIDGYDPENGSAEDGSSEADHERMVAAEVASSMRVLRTRGRRNTITPIRPSLVGALEFRSALAQLQREGNLQLSDIPNIPGRSYSDNQIPRHRRRGITTGLPEPRQTDPGFVDHLNDSPTRRDRAMSSGDVPHMSTTLPDFLGPVIESPESTLAPPSPGGRERSPSPSPSYTVDGNLAPPPTAQGMPQLMPPEPSPRRQLLGHHLKLQVPSRRSSYSDQSSPSSPFPHYTDSPALLTPNPHVDPSEFISPGTVLPRESPFADLSTSIESPKPVRWWSYSILPPPHVLLATVFPTLQAWREKSILDKLVSVISVPSIFLLVVTLPVVESETTEEESVHDFVESHRRSVSVGHVAPPISIVPDAIEPETEWQRYRRRTLVGHSYLSTPVSPGGMSRSFDDHMVRSTPTLNLGAPAIVSKPVSEAPTMSLANDECAGWNRWLVALQLFTGPQFAILILWANMREDWDQPGRVLVKMVLYTLLASLVLLGVLVLCTVEHARPKHHYLLCFLGFIISIAWISTIAGEVVGVLKTFGVVLGISEALLGLTIFAAGNSVGDLIADITVARLGYPVMAL